MLHTHTNTKALWTAKSQREPNQHSVWLFLQLLRHTPTPGVQGYVTIWGMGYGQTGEGGGGEESL